MRKVINYIKNEVVLVVAAAAALISIIFVPIGVEYIKYIDFAVLSILFCLMAVVAGFMGCGVFDILSNKLIRKCSNIQLLAFVLTALCFFGAMLITNDVVLISFVPLTIAMLHSISPNRLVYIIVIETVAANLGSMLTPIGNPQNLYLYSYYNMDISQFFAYVFPFCIFSLLLLAISLIFFKGGNIAIVKATAPRLDKRKVLMYSLLFLICVSAVLHFIDYRLCLIIVVVALLLFDRKIFIKIDYALLLTFVAFFVFVGNLSSISFVKELLSHLIKEREFCTGIVASQIISNVPAAIMLSGFTDKAKELLLGVNIGGLGTIIASLASLISYKLYAKSKDAKPILFLGIFTIVNIAFLFANMILAKLILV